MSYSRKREETVSTIDEKPLGRLVAIEDSMPLQRTRRDYLNDEIDLKSNIWRLQARAISNDARPEEVTSLKVWLRPGTHCIGKQKRTNDVQVRSDKSISATHAKICVEKGKEYVVVQDCSKYGTLVSPEPDLKREGEKMKSMNAYHAWFVRFGLMSVFELKREVWGVVCHPSVNDSDKMLVEDVGMKRLESLHRVECLKGVKMVVSDVPKVVDGTLLLAALQGVPILTWKWLEEWNSKQTWVGKHPPEEQYLVSLPFLARNEVTEKNGDKKYKILKTEEAAKNLRHLTFVWPWEHVSEIDKDFLAALAFLGLNVCMTTVSRMLRDCINIRKPVLLLKSSNQMNTIQLPHFMKQYCEIESLIVRPLRKAITTGNTSEILNSIPISCISHAMHPSKSKRVSKVEHFDTEMKDLSWESQFKGENSFVETKANKYVGHWNTVHRILEVTAAPDAPGNDICNADLICPIASEANNGDPEAATGDNIVNNEQDRTARPNFKAFRPKRSNQKEDRKKKGQTIGYHIVFAQQSNELLQEWERQEKERLVRMKENEIFESVDVKRKVRQRRR